MFKQLATLTFLLAQTLLTTAQPTTTNLLKLVNPFIGTGGHGHTYPGATAPFGMVQLSPDTRLDPGDWDGCGGYHYSDSTIYGFSHTHLSGTGVSDFCDILIQPFVGAAEFDPAKYGSTFSKKTEKAEPAFYSVVLEKHKIKAEMTATERVGVHRYTFPKGVENASLLLDLRHRDVVLDAQLEIVGDREIAGMRRSKSWANDQNLFFVARFSRPFSNPKLVDTSNPSAPNSLKINAKTIVGVFQFEKNDEPLVVTVGVSATSIEGARRNLEAEVNHFDFEKIKAETQARWAAQLSKVEVTGGTAAQRTTFYTALYHTMVVPNIASDVDGSYRGRDQKIHFSDRPVYSVFSLWDTYRAAHPLYTLLEPERAQDFVNSFLLQYRDGGLLPVWELASCETDCMIGNHAIPVIADAWLKGLRNFDGQKALEAMLKSANSDRFGLEFYRQRGYIPSHREPESVSKTLEYAYDDYAIARMAESLGNQDVAREFYRRAQSYKNIFDHSTRFFRAKSNATWHTPFDPFEVNFNYTEANAWQYRFAAPQDVSGMIRLHGGRENFAKALDEIFSAKTATSGRVQADLTGLVGQYVQGNEPSHHIAYLYNFVGQPHKTQQRVQQIMREMYSDQPDGLSGNEDCGQMSAWFVFSAMGFYPVNPVGGQYVLGSPLFEKTILHLPTGNKFMVQAKAKSDKNIYLQNARLGGVPYARSYIWHDKIAYGGELIFEMIDLPSIWGTRPENCPVSKIDAPAIVTTPFVAAGKRVFEKKQSIQLATPDTATLIFYTLDGSVPTSKSKTYAKPFSISKNTTLRAIAVRDGQTSNELNAVFTKMRDGLKVEKYNCQFSNQYTGRGKTGLVDQIRGAADFRSGDWQGFEGQNFDVVFDLGKKQGIDRVVAGFLQDENSWIFFPKKVRVEISADGKNFQPAGEVETKVAPAQKGTFQQDFEVKMQAGAAARFVRVVGESLMVCPADHKGAGLPCWLMADEVLVD